MDKTCYRTLRKACIPRLSFDEIPLKPQQVIKEIIRSN